MIMYNFRSMSRTGSPVDRPSAALGSMHHPAALFSPSARIPTPTIRFTLVHEDNIPTGQLWHGEREAPEAKLADRGSAMGVSARMLGVPLKGGFGRDDDLFTAASTRARQPRQIDERNLYTANIFRLQ